jgi:hypothetical protein
MKRLLRIYKYNIQARVHVQRIYNMVSVAYTGFLRMPPHSNGSKYDMYILREYLACRTDLLHIYAHTVQSLGVFVHRSKACAFKNARDITQKSKR